MNIVLIWSYTIFSSYLFITVAADKTDRVPCSSYTSKVSKLSQPELDYMGEFFIPIFGR